MIDVVVGLDPPRGWALWGDAGPIAAGQVEGTNREARVACLEALDAAVAALNARVRAVVVEQPHGDEGAGTPDDFVQLAMAAGWMESECEHRRWPVTLLRASQWRSALKWPAMERKGYKDFSHRFATKTQQECGASPLLVVLVGPGIRLKDDKRGPGARRIDAADALCISAAGSIILQGYAGVLLTWKNTGTFSSTPPTS